MMPALRIVPEPDSSAAGASSGSSAFKPDPVAPRTLVFRIHAEPDVLEVLRAVRRAMLREEATLGRRDGEPPLEDAIFSVEGIVWRVQADQTEYGLEKIATLEARVLRALSGRQTPGEGVARPREGAAG
jgi:hypothetical protein